MKSVVIVLLLGGIMCVDLLEASKGLLPFLRTSTDITKSYPVYRPPAMGMREAADRMDREDAAVKRFREAVERCAGKEGG